jgi:hypothetical protein
MKKDDQLNGPYAAQAWTYVGAILFLVALLVSAIAVPQLRLLHSFQALIYVAVVAFVRRNSPWGYGAGFAIAIIWNAMSLFVSHLMQAGAIAVWLSLRTGQLHDLVPMMVALGGVGHFILIAAALIALVGHNTEPRKWWKFVGGGVLSIAYFALIISFTQPH